MGCHAEGREQVQVVGHGNLKAPQSIVQAGIRTDWGMDKLGQLCHEGFRLGEGREAGHEPAVCACSAESQMCPGLHQRQWEQ